MRAVLLVLALLLAGCSADEPQPETAIQEPETTPEARQLALVSSINQAALQGDSLRVVGNTSGALIEVSLIQNGASSVQFSEQVNGTFEVTLQPDYGRGTVNVTADDGVSLQWNAHAFTRLAPATFLVDYGAASSTAPVSDELWVDLGAFASAAMYDGVSGEHAGFTTVHDVMVHWENSNGHVIDYSWSESFTAFNVEAIDGEGNPLDSSAPPWWCYKVNGESPELGISLQPFQPGDEIAWNLGTCS